VRPSGRESIEYLRWSRLNAMAMMSALLTAATSREPAVIGVLGAVSFAVLLYRMRPAFRPSGFGLANAITTLRLLLTLGLLGFGKDAPGSWLFLGALAIVTLDGVDGWAARRFATAGEFGARYDTAVDSLYTLALCALLHARGEFGAWVLLAGAWHYFYVLAIFVFEARREAKRSRLGATVFVALVSTMGAAFLLPVQYAAPLVALAVALQSASFLKSFWECFGPAG
jgi:phosphatidylglycerophosphate synthase